VEHPQARRLSEHAGHPPDRDRTGTLRQILQRNGPGPIYVILDNLSAHEGTAIRAWAARNKVELCFTPTYASWANPIEAQFGRYAPS
jgi:transposase